MKNGIAKMAIAFALVLAGVIAGAAQMWSEDMSNGARSNLGSQSVQPRATRNASPRYGAADRTSTQRDNSGKRGHARSDRDAWQNTWQDTWGR